MRLIVGKIIKPHGIRGEVIVEVRTDDPEARFAVGSVLMTDPTAMVPSPSPDAGAPGWRPPERMTVEASRFHLGRYIIQFDGVYDRTPAEALRGLLLCVDSSQVPPPDDPDEFNDHELVGLTAVAADGQVLGTVIRVDHPPASDMLVLRLPDGRSALVPFVKAIVPEVDVPGGRMVVTPPGGLFDL